STLVTGAAGAATRPSATHATRTRRSRTKSRRRNGIPRIMRTTRGAASASSSLCQSNRQRRELPHREVLRVRGRAVERRSREATEERAERRLDLEARERCAEAVVRPGAEGDGRRRIALHVEARRIRERRLVVQRARDEEERHLPLLDGAPVELDVLEREAMRA